jgi:hypothetical protein
MFSQKPIRTILSKDAPAAPKGPLRPRLAWSHDVLKAANDLVQRSKETRELARKIAKDGEDPGKDPDFQEAYFLSGSAREKFLQIARKELGQPDNVGLGTRAKVQRALAGSPTKVAEPESVETERTESRGMGRRS